MNDPRPLFLTVTRADGTIYEIRADAIRYVERREDDVLVALTNRELVLTYPEAKPVLEHLALLVRLGL